MPWLVASVKARGQLVPARVRANPPDASGRRTYVIISGHRRKTALRLAGRKTIKAIIVTDPQTPAEIHFDSMADNNARKSLKPIEVVDSIAKAKRDNPLMANKDIAEQAGSSPTEVSKCLTIAECSIAYAALVAGQTKGIEDTYEVAKAPPQKKQLMISARAGGATKAEMQAAAKATTVETPSPRSPRTCGTTRSSPASTTPWPGRSRSRWVRT